MQKTSNDCGTMDAEMQKTFGLSEDRAGRVGMCNSDDKEVGRSIPVPSLLFLYAL
jgi:hypothetical protein